MDPISDLITLLSFLFLMTTIVNEYVGKPYKEGMITNTKIYGVRGIFKLPPRRVQKFKRIGAASVAVLALIVLRIGFEQGWQGLIEFAEAVWLPTLVISVTNPVWHAISMYEKITENEERENIADNTA